ncbi:TPA: hypothetical protein N0F65_000314 [Lagenidium giganteum]|uniref:Uncharacterized protein n=1 Tax=Lagenidium giganteum TaxID=4803 RepID=A0AAV2Z9G0_9STRA|nr:TPA: hypothetical protein N0F65_000314 [Lagenidium giganteum]
MATVVAPGTRIGELSSTKPGHGTYVMADGIYASIAGVTRVHEGEVSVRRSGKTLGSAQVLGLDDPVLARIVKVTARQLLVDIVCVRDTVLQESFAGTLRLEDVRSYDVDKVDLEKMFSPGMLLKAVVLSYGDTRSYFLSTAKSGMGIVRPINNEGK